MDVDAAEMKARIHQPCAACRMLRRRCDSNCLLAPYFPTHEIENFVGVHKVFGASNVIKMIQMVEEEKREDAVKGMVYEARSRLRDPVYGSAGAILQFQNMIEELQAQLESITTQLSELRQQKEHLLSILHHSNKSLSNDYYGGHLDHPALFSMNVINDPIFDGYSIPDNLSVDADQFMAFDSLEFPV